MPRTTEPADALAGYGLTAMLLVKSLLASRPATVRRKAVKRAMDDLDATAPPGLAAAKARRLLVGMLAREWSAGEELGPTDPP
jgi:hypothetical protein